jgi:hypothetical protein
LAQRSLPVIAGLDPAIQGKGAVLDDWIAGSCPAKTGGSVEVIPALPDATTMPPLLHRNRIIMFEFEQMACLGEMQAGSK